jgi:hypothetical protein
LRLGRYWLSLFEPPGSELNETVEFVCELYTVCCCWTYRYGGCVCCGGA